MIGATCNRPALMAGSTTSADRTATSAPASTAVRSLSLDGIVSATVTLWKQDNRGDWYQVIGEAYWDEFAPIKDEWAEDPETRRGR